MIKRLNERIALLRNKKEKGGATDALLVFCVLLIVFMVMMVITISAFSNIHNKWNIRQCAREYLLLAESQGCLTSEDLVSMENELNKYGLVNVDFAPAGEIPTSTVQVPFGETVYVTFKGTFTNKVGALNQGGNMFKYSEVEEDFVVRRQTTSKY